MLFPLMLLGLAGLAVPVILHLIQRQRLKPQVLATMRFLDPQDAANAFAPVPRDLLQLVLRLLLLGLFVLLMTRLYRGGAAVGPRSLVVVFDQSLGMQRKVGEQTLFQIHKARLLELIDSLGPQDRMALILAGDEVSPDEGFLPPAELRKIVENLDVSDGGGLALTPAIRRAVGLLSGRREVNSCVLVFSDHQLASYQPALDELPQTFSTNVARTFREGLEGGRVRLLLVDENPPTGVNLSIERAVFEPASVHVGASSRMTAVVRNHTDKPQTTQVRLSEGAQVDPPRSLTLDPGEAAHIDLVHRFESPVDAVCQVELDDDLLPADNRFWLPVRVRDRRQVLLVAPASDGDERSLEIGSRGIDLLTYALNPGEVLGKGSGTFVGVKRVSPQGLARVSLPLYSLIVLQGVTELPEQAGRDLLAFVQSGGGVWIIPEGDVSPVRFQAAFEKLLGGFTLGALKQAEPVQAVSRDESRLNHPLLTPLLREEWGSLREVHFDQYHAVQELGTAKLALRAVNGDPLALLIEQGRGRVFVQTFGVSLEASSLPRTIAFVPLVQEVSAVLGPRRDLSRPDTLRAGEMRLVEVPEFRGLRGEVYLWGPVRSSAPLLGAENDEIRVKGLTRAGPYEVHHPLKKTARQRWVTVNPVSAASDLTTLDVTQQAELFGTKNVVRVSGADIDAQFTRNHELLVPLLVLVFVAFAVEAAVGAWQSRRKPAKGAAS